MTADLPPAIRNYFAGKNARDFDTAAAGFSASAVIRDEGNDHRGTAAIRRWIEETTTQYDDRAEVKDVSAEDEAVHVSAEVSGAFPGSPILLRFSFTLDGGKISHLEIRS